MNNYKLFFTIAAIAPYAILLSCNSATDQQNENSTDSMAICRLLQNVYHWHDANAYRIPDFPIIVKDTLQVGLDTIALMNAVNEIKGTHFFTDGFVKNYERIGRETDHKLRYDTVKYYNEINFSFQDADPWTFFQDTAGDYWNNLRIHDFTISGDTASIGWTLRDMPDSDAYYVGFKRESNEWKVAYLQGFDKAWIGY